jgi:ATP-binding cassette, subfamily B (MDR/TAP), member 1
MKIRHKITAPAWKVDPVTTTNAIATTKENEYIKSEREKTAMTAAAASDHGPSCHEDNKRADKEMMLANDSAKTNKNKMKKAQVQPAASLSDTLSFMFGCGTRCKILFYVGVLAGTLNGLVYPAMAYLFSDAVEELAQAGGVTSMDSMREMALRFVYIGFYTFALTAVQTSCLEMASNRAKMAFTSQWFSALLRQDPAFFDVHNISGVATQIGPMAEQYARGVGPKFGEIAEYLSAAVGGMAYAYYSCWKVALVVTCSIPLVSIFAVVTVKFNTTKSRRSAIAYKRASSVAYTAVSAMKTVSSLNAAWKMIEQYTTSTRDGLRMAVNSVIKQGLAYGKSNDHFYIHNVSTGCLFVA